MNKLVSCGYQDSEKLFKYTTAIMKICFPIILKRKNFTAPSPFPRQALQAHWGAKRCAALLEYLAEMDTAEINLSEFNKDKTVVAWDAYYYISVLLRANLITARNKTQIEMGMSDTGLIANLSKFSHEEFKYAHKDTYITLTDKALNLLNA